VPLLLAFDGNSLTHRAYHAAVHGRLLDGDGRPVWAVKGLVMSIARAAAQLRPDAIVVGFDCGETSARKADFPGYKAQRPDKPADLAGQLAEAPGMLREAGFPVVVPAAYEADDVLASAAATARAAGWRAVVVTSDRDSFALVDDTTSVLRVRNGGLDRAVLVTAAGLRELYGIEGWQYRDFAALCGDSSDNLDGAKGFGPATAAKLLAAVGSLDAAFAALDVGRDAEVRDAVGAPAASQLASQQMREIVMRNRRLMLMRTDLPLPDLDAMRLPIELAGIRRVLSARGIHLGPSLWALTGGSPPQDEPPVRVVRPRPARRAPCEGQLSLF